jgi:hypothetical protein
VSSTGCYTTFDRKRGVHPWDLRPLLDALEAVGSTNDLSVEAIRVVGELREARVLRLDFLSRRSGECLEPLGYIMDLIQVVVLSNIVS